MKIVFVIVGVLASKTRSLGVPYAAGLGKALVAKGYSLAIVTSKAGEILFKNLGLDAEFWLVDGQEDIVKPNLMHLTIIMMKRMFKAGFLLRNKKFDQGTIIFSMSSLLWEIFPLLFVKDKPVIRISTFNRAPSPLTGYKGANIGKKKFPSLMDILFYFQSKLTMSCIKHVSDVIIAHPGMSHDLRDIGIPEEKIVPIHIGVEWDIINSVTPSEMRYDACWVRKLDPQKQYHDLLEIWETVAKAKRNAKLAVMGSVEKLLRPVTEQKRLEENIEFKESLSDEMKYKVMKESSVFLSPTYYEIVPFAVIEAMACGLPVVAYDLPIYRSYFPRGMVRVPIGDKQAFAQAVIDILNDNEKRRRLADEAATLAPEYSWDKAAGSFLLEVNRLGCLGIRKQ